jgi:hypothetical protein
LADTMFHRPKARELAMRSPAQAALLGAFAGTADFGGFGGFGGFGEEAGALAHASREMAAHASRGLPQHAALLRADAHQLSELSKQEHKEAARAQREQSRLDMLDPNEGLATKIARYSFSINFPFVVGTATAINATLQPDTKIRPQRVIMNAPTQQFILVTTIKVANVSVLVGANEDAFTYSATSVGVHLDMPTLDPSNRATVQGVYTGLVPAPFTVGFAYTFITTFQGPATVTAGG